MSNTLTVGLAVLGGLVLAGVVAHGAWNTRRNSPRIAQPESTAQQDQPLDERSEPTMDAFGNVAGVGSVGNVGDMSFESNLVALSQPDNRPHLDPLIDVITPISLEADVLGGIAVSALPATRRVGSKAFAVEGFNVRSNQWEVPVPEQSYSAFQAGVQLANRTGALNDIEYSEFVVKTQTFADAVGGAPEFPEMLDEVARARELDHFASSHDAQLSFTLRAKSSAWSPGYVQQHAARQGLIAGAIPGKMVLPASTQAMPAVLHLAYNTQAALAALADDMPEQTAIRELNLSIDVPQVSRAEQPFVRLREVANALATSMDGVITDDHGNPIRLEALDAIGADLETLYDTLDARDLAAGSAQARRLFS